MKKGLTIFFLVFTLQSCGVDLDVLEYAGSELPVENGIDILLVFPENNTEINEGENISTTESKLIFKWANIGEADFSPYNLHLVNLKNNDTIVYESLESESNIILQRNTRYSWSVTGISNSKSETWLFDNIGPEIVSSSPMAATPISPANNSSISQTSTTVNLIWKSEDIDNDIIGHDLYFGETEDPMIFIEDVTETRFNDIPVEAGKIYYWKIITKDSIGNESTSEVFTFSVG